MNALELANKLDWDAENGEGDWQFQEAAADMIRHLYAENATLRELVKHLEAQVYGGTTK